VTDNLRGILAVLIGSAAFVLNDAVVKLASDELPSGEILVVRGVLSTVMLWLGVVAMRASRPISTLLGPMMLLRLFSAAAATAATVFIVISLRHLSLATVNTVLQVTPLTVTAGAALLLGERVGWQRWLAALAGFLGVLLIIQPGAHFESAAYIVLTALVFTTMRDLSTRSLERGVPSILVAAASAAAITLAGFAVIPFDADWSMPTDRAWGLLTASAACLFVANTSIIIAMRTGEIAVVAPFRYIAVPLAVLVGWWWWGDIPDPIAFVGIGLVAVAGLYTLHRERGGLRAVPAVQRSPAE
jgi:drug/metabolite transporter (DMT)-like permease